MWSVLGNILNPKKHSKVNKINHITYQGATYDKDMDIANALNSHFCKVGEKISSKIKPANLDFSAYLTDAISTTFFLKPVDVNEVVLEMQYLKLKKSPGDDGITPSKN